MRITGASLRPPSSEADGDLGGRATRTGHHSLPRRPRSGRCGRSHGRAPARGACCLHAAPCAGPLPPALGSARRAGRERSGFWSGNGAHPALRPSLCPLSRGLGWGSGLTPSPGTGDPPPAPWGCLTPMEGAFHIACAGLPPGISSVFFLSSTVKFFNPGFPRLLGSATERAPRPGLLGGLERRSVSSARLGPDSPAQTGLPLCSCLYGALVSLFLLTGSSAFVKYF